MPHARVDAIARLNDAKRQSADDAIGYAMHSSRSHDAVIRVYDAAGNVIQGTNTLAKKWAG